MNKPIILNLITAIVILTAIFMFGMLIGRATAPQPQTIPWDDPFWTHRDDLTNDNLTPATQEYLEAP
jgi:hypothetical protein